MKRIYVNEDRCLGCRLCETYCAAANSEYGKRGDKRYIDHAFNIGKPPVARIHVESDKGDNTGINFAVQCRHCDVPHCVKGCITGALSVKDGVITCDESRCVGCYTCVLSCPYGSIVIPPEESLAENNSHTIHPIKKCDLCISRGGDPACVKGCPNLAIYIEERN